jgi:hypothetical protein
VQEIQLITTFIRERENRTDQIVDDLKAAQYEWVAVATGAPLEKVRAIVEKWIDKVPLNYIYSCRHPEVLQLFECITNRGIEQAISS